MPIAANSHSNGNNIALSPDNPLSQLQQAAHQVAPISTSNALPTPSSTTGQAIDGARNAVAPGAQYTSIRRITRRVPEVSEYCLDGIDTTNVNLSWTAKEDGHGINPDTGEPWLYPKKGHKEGSNLVDFKDEIEERTKNGQGCKAIAEALIAKGVDTSSRAVSRQRMKWGLRQRAPRRMTEQGIANIRRAHLEQAQRLANSDPVPVKRVRIRVMRKAEITRMTKEGMSPADIAQNLIARGFQLKRGAATVERLRTVWGLVPNSERNPHNVRQFCRNQAMRVQKEQFENIARELGIENVDAWVKSKMDEGVASDARREHAYKLMGDLRPKSIDPSIARQNTQYLPSLRGQNRTQPQGAHFEDPGQQGVSVTTGKTPGAGATAGGIPEDVMELSTDEDDLDSVAGEDDHDVDMQHTPTQAPAEAQRPPQTAVKMEESGPISLQGLPASQSASQVPSPPTPSNLSSSSTPGPSEYHGRGHAFSANTNVYQSASMHGPHWQGNNPGPGHLAFDGNRPPATGPHTGQQPLRPAQGSNTAPCIATHSPHPTQGCMEPLSLGPVAPRAFAPPPTGPRPLAPRPIVPRLPAANASPSEAELMAKYGLFPYPTFNKSAQKYLTPMGLITTVGYEYLPIWHQAAPSPQQFPPQVTMMPSNQSPVSHLPNGQPIPSDVILVPPPPPPAPLPQVSRIPAPSLAIPPEEIKKHQDDSKAIEKYQKATQECLDLLAARSSNRPLVDSLTGMPPSLKDITNAKERLREAARAMLEVV